MATGARGEGVIVAGQREYRILFTNRALADAEAQMGKSVIGVAQGFADGQSGITDVAHLLRAGLQAARRDSNDRHRATTLTEAYKVMDEVGFTQVAATVMEAVAAVLGYSAEADEDLLDDPDVITDPN